MFVLFPLLPAPPLTYLLPQILFPFISLKKTEGLYVTTTNHEEKIH